MTKLQIYQLIHVIGIVLLVGLAFSACAAPTPERKRRLAIGSGILALAVLVSGFGLLSVLHDNRFGPWVYVKIGAWLGIAALTTIVFRRPGVSGFFMLIIAVLAAAAVYAVYVLRLGS